MLVADAHAARHPALADLVQQRHDQVQDQRARAEEQRRPPQQLLGAARVHAIDGGDEPGAQLRQIGRAGAAGAFQQRLDLRLVEARHLADRVAAIDQLLDPPQPRHVNVRVQAPAARAALGRDHAVPALPDAQRLDGDSGLVRDGADAIASLRGGSAASALNPSPPARAA